MEICSPQVDPANYAVGQYLSQLLLKKQMYTLNFTAKYQLGDPLSNALNQQTKHRQNLKLTCANGEYGHFEGDTILQGIGKGKTSGGFITQQVQAKYAIAPTDVVKNPVTLTVVNNIPTYLRS